MLVELSVMEQRYQAFAGGTSIRTSLLMEAMNSVSLLSRGRFQNSKTDAEISGLCARLAAYGMSARHLRTFQTSAERNAALLGQITAPALHGRSPERRRAGLEDLRALGELAQELSQLLLWRSLGRLAG